MHARDDTGVTLQVLVLGFDQVGKSSLSMRLGTGKFIDATIQNTKESTIQCPMTINDQRVLLEVRDATLEGEFPFTKRVKSIRNTKGIVLVYSISSKYSFDKLCDLREQILRIREHLERKTCSMVLIGTKLDEEETREVSFEEGEELAEAFHIPFFETSSKDGTNVKEAFESLTKDMLTIYGE